jgi:hypothetical protein
VRGALNSSCCFALAGSRSAPSSLRSNQQKQFLFEFERGLEARGYEPAPTVARNPEQSAGTLAGKIDVTYSEPVSASGL